MRLDVLQAAHEFVVLQRILVPSRVSLQPLAKRFIEGAPLGTSDGACPLDQIFVSAERYVLHEYSVHEIRVQENEALYLWPSVPAPSQW